MAHSMRINVSNARAIRKSLHALLCTPVVDISVSLSVRSWCEHKINLCLALIKHTVYQFVQFDVKSLLDSMTKDEWVKEWHKPRAIVWSNQIVDNYYNRNLGIKSMVLLRIQTATARRSVHTKLSFAMTIELASTMSKLLMLLLLLLLWLTIQWSIRISNWRKPLPPKRSRHLLEIIF